MTRTGDQMEMGAHHSVMAVTATTVMSPGGQAEAEVLVLPGRREGQFNFDLGSILAVHASHGDIRYSVGAIIVPTRETICTSLASAIKLIPVTWKLRSLKSAV